MEEDKGAFVFEEDGEFVIFIYAKLMQFKLMNFLPMSYQENKGEYYLVVFKDNLDHVGQTNKTYINNYIAKYKMINILDNDFDSLNKNFPNLTNDEFEKINTFVNDQLKKISKDTMAEKYMDVLNKLVNDEKRKKKRKKKISKNTDAYKFIDALGKFTDDMKVSKDAETDLLLNKPDK